MLKTSKENKGVALIASLMVAVVLSILSGAYISSSLVQSNAAQREKVQMQNFYAAEKGVEYAFVEAQNHSWNWKTYNINATTNDLTPAGAQPTISLSTVASYNANHNYEIATPSGPIEVKTYANPDKNSETWVLSRSGSKIIRFKITQRSLYKYFYYYPSAKNFGWIPPIDGKSKGGIYVNGNIWLASMTFNNITELSTNKASSISLWRDSYSPPYELDDKDGIRDGKAPLPQFALPHIYSLSKPYPWDWKWPPGRWPPLDWKSEDNHFFNAGTVNGVTLPRTLSTSWDWDKYGGSDKSSVIEPDVQFYDSNGVLATATYWSDLESGYGGASYFDSVGFWADKIYKRSSETTSVNYLNTATQAVDWTNWLNSSGSALKGVVKTGADGYPVSPLNIETNYSQLAKTNGLYIGKDELGNLDVWLNGVETDSLPLHWVTDNVRFFNTVRPKDKDGDGVIGDIDDRENVLQFNIVLSDVAVGQLPNNAIIYVAHKSIKLINGDWLPQKLTIVSPYNIYGSVKIFWFKNS